MPAANVRRQILVLLLAAIPAAALVAWLHPRAPNFAAEKSADRVRLEDVVRWEAPPLWIDARKRAAFEAAHVPEALLLNEDTWEELLPSVIERWRPDTLIVVYCDSAECDASEAVANRLRRELGTGKVYVLNGGWRTWVDFQKRR